MNIQRSSLLIAFLSLFLISKVSAEEGKRVQWVLDESYAGSHQTSFQKLRYQIPNLMRQTCINIAVRTGMDFQDGWRYPLEVGFVDGSPMGMENVLAYVQLGRMSDGTFAQQLNINLDAYEREAFNLEKVFAHELVHAMLNDAIGGQAATTLPVWFHEGLAVFGADQGDGMVKAYANRFFGMGENAIINGLEGPHGALDYAEDYLAMKYINEKIGSNAFHNFIKEVIRTNGNIPQSLQYTCFISWPDFQEKLKEYSRQYLKDLGPSRRGGNSNPY